MLMALLITVAVGLVDGVTEAITPQGAFSIRVRPMSPEMAMGERHSVPGVRSQTRIFLAILSLTRPMPVSLWAISANALAFSRPALRMAAMILSRMATVLIFF